MWHELSHVYVLAMTNSRVPRWFTEGLAVFEETGNGNPDWGDRLDPEAINAIKTKKLLPIAELDRGFIHPTYPAQVIVSYFQAGKICNFIDREMGLRQAAGDDSRFRRADAHARSDREGIQDEARGVRPTVPRVAGRANQNHRGRIR